jgi:hypothetical protein
VATPTIREEISILNQPLFEKLLQLRLPVFPEGLRELYNEELKDLTPKAKQ